MAFGVPASFDLEALLTGKDQPLPAAAATGAPVRAPATAGDVLGLHAAPRPSSTGVDVLGLRRTAVAAPAATTVASFGAASRPAGMAAVEAASRAMGKTKLSSAAQSAVAPDADASQEASPAPSGPVLVWGSSEIPSTLPAARVVPSTPFFLSTSHRVLFTDGVTALKLVADAIASMDGDMSIDPPSGTLSCTVIRPEGRCDFDVARWAVPEAEGFETAHVVELRRRAGDKYAFHDNFLRFTAQIRAAADAAGVAMASSVSDERVAPIAEASVAERAVFGSSPLALSASDKAATTEALDGVAAAATREDELAAEALVEAISVDDAVPEAPDAEAEASLAALPFDTIAGMLRSQYDDVREEGAQRAVAALMAPSDSSSASRTSCRAALRERGIARDLVAALVRAQCGSGCQAHAAMALSLMAQCGRCADDMVDCGAVFALSGIVMAPCKRQTIRLRRAAARALGTLAGSAAARAHAAEVDVIPYLRLAAGVCPDPAFRGEAASAADRLDPAGAVTDVDASGIDFTHKACAAIGRARDTVTL